MDTVRAGPLDELREKGTLLTKLGHIPVVVFWHEDRAYAIEDRCPHMGFPLHQGTVESGLVTCHWHHARFDLESGCTLDLWADDARSFAVDVEGDDVMVSTRRDGSELERLQTRLREGMEGALTLVIAKSVLGLLDAGANTADIVRTGIEFGTRYRGEGWGVGLTTLVAMANVLPDLADDDRATALVHALRLVAQDSQGQAPRFPVAALRTTAVPADRLSSWYRRFIDTRAGDAAERTLATAAQSEPLPAVEHLMMAAVTDHVFIDDGHTLDFTNKAFESLRHVGPDAAGPVLTTLVSQTAAAERSEESSEWQYPHDLVALMSRRMPELATALDGVRRPVAANANAALAHALLVDEPDNVTASLIKAAYDGASEADLGQAIAFAASLRLVRFHTQNEHGDWNTVHHTFTTASALHRSLRRAPSRDTARGLLQVALRIYLDRFLNVPAARMPRAERGNLDELVACFDTQGHVDEAGNIAYGYLRGGGQRGDLVATLGRAMLGEDTGFHWYQSFEASVFEASTWPDGEESALILAGFARFLAAHTPTRRELPNVIRIATRLRRGEELFADEDGSAVPA